MFVLSVNVIECMQVMMLVEALCRRAEAKMATLPSSPSSCNNAQLIDQVQQRTAFLASSLSLAEIELSENLRQQQESRAFKGRPAFPSSIACWSTQLLNLHLINIDRMWLLHLIPFCLAALETVLAKA